MNCTGVVKLVMCFVNHSVLSGNNRIRDVCSCQSLFVYLRMVAIRNATLYIFGYLG